MSEEKSLRRLWILQAVAYVIATAFVWIWLFMAIYPLQPEPHKLSSQITQNQIYRQTQPDGFWAFKIIDVLTVIILLIQAGIFAAQTYLANKQRELMAGQLEATRTAAEAALASLARPWLIIEELSHNQSIWTGGGDILKAHFRIANYGNAPGFIMFINAGLFLSPGPEMNDAFPFKPWPNHFKKFPEELALPSFKRDISLGLKREHFRSTVNGTKAVYDAITIDDPLPVRADEKTISFSILSHAPVEQPEKAIPIESLAKIFLAGDLGYAGPDGRLEVISFFYYANPDGSFSPFRGAPYNQRTKYTADNFTDAMLGL